MIFKKELANELFVFLLASVFMAFIFAIKLKWPVLTLEPLAILLGFLYALIMFALFIGVQKLVAFALDCRTTTKLLSFRRYWFKPHSIFPFEFPAWFFLPVILALVGIKWPAILNFDVEPKITHVRQRWQNITESDIGKIAISGPLAVMALGILMRVFGANEFAFLCVLFTFAALIPIGMGFKLFNSSRILWFFSFVFSLAVLLLINIQSVFAVILTAVIFAALATISYYVLYEK
ncbi:MAG: hypothetical protein ACPLXC_00770 [Candidatus Pacearchaeota archaeon]